MELSLNSFRSNSIHLPGFRGEDGGIVKLNVVSQVDGCVQLQAIYLGVEVRCSVDGPLTWYPLKGPSWACLTAACLETFSFNSKREYCIFRCFASPNMLLSKFNRNYRKGL